MEPPRTQRSYPATFLAGALALACVFFAGWLVLGPSPSETGIAAAEASGDKVRTSHYVVTGLWRAALVNLLVCLALIPFAKRLSRSTGGAPPEFSLARDAASGVRGRWVLLSVLAAIGLTSYHAAPRLEHGLWHDESKGVRNFVVGRYDRSKTTGEARYREVTWLESVWNYRFPHHTFFGLLARTSHTVAPPTGDRPDRFYVNEAAIRLPSLGGALGGLAATAWMLWLLGLRRAAVIAPLLLALHPWFLRYAAEARGYSLLFFFGPLCIALATKGLNDGRWRWWMALAVAQFLTVWSVLNGLYLLLALNAAVAIWIWTKRGHPAAPALFGRWLLSGAVAGLIAVWMMLPLLPQFLEYVAKTGDDYGKYGKRIVRDMLSSYTAGMRYSEFGGGGGGHLRGNVMGTVLAALVGLVAITGVVSIWRRGTAGRLALVFLLVPAPLFYLHCTVSKPHIFYWYVIIGLPLFWAVVAQGCAAAGDRLLRKLPSPGLAAGLVLLLAMAVIGHPKRAWLRANPVEAERESVLAIRGAFVDPTSPEFTDVIMLGFCRDPILYDLHTIWAEGRDGFVAALRSADTEGKPLFVNYGPVKAYQHCKGIMKLVDDPALFETEAEFEGIDAGSDRVVKRYRSGSIGALVEGAGT